MVGKALMQTVSDKPADREIHLRFTHQPAVVDDPEQQSRKHQSHRYFRINPWPAGVRAIAVRCFFAQPVEVENPIDPRQDVIPGYQLLQRPGDEQLLLLAIFQTQHLVGLRH